MSPGIARKIGTWPDNAGGRKNSDCFRKTQGNFNKKDGDTLKKGEIIAIIKGKTKNVLLGERVALNLLQRMCGIATLTNNFSKKLAGTNAKLADTRKTTPNLRILEKYSVKIGGGINHRCNLSDGILIKDNHIDAAGSITNAINLIKKNSSFVRKIEVETENLDMVKEALECNADIIMLDNEIASSYENEEDEEDNYEDDSYDDDTLDDDMVDDDDYSDLSIVDEEELENEN